MQHVKMLNSNILMSMFSLLFLLLFALNTTFAAFPKNRLVYLPDRDLEILYVGQKGKWCDSRLDLVLVTSQPLTFQDKKLINLQMVRLIIKLRKSCPAISQVGIVGYSRIEPDTPLLEGSYLAKDAWKFSKLKLPVRFEAPQVKPVKASENKAKTARAPKTAPKPKIAREPNRVLTFQESQELQKRLTFLGFATGNINNQTGPQTAVAISSFLARYNLSLPARPDLDILLAVRKASGVSGQPNGTTAKAPRRAELLNYVDVGNRLALNLDRLFALKTARNTPNLLNNNRILLSWLEQEAEDNYSPLQARSFALKRTYDNGTTFQKTDVLKSFRTLIESEVRRRNAELSQPLALMIRLGARISEDYRNGQGFPIVTRRGFGFSQRTYSGRRVLNYYVKRLGRDLYFPLPARSSISRIPILDERKARTLALLLRERRRYSFEMRFYMIVKNVSFLTSGGRELLAENTVNRFSLEMLDRNDLSGKAKLVYNWGRPSSPNRQKNGAAARKPTALDFARWANIKLIRNNLVLGDWRESDRVNFQASRDKNRSPGNISKTGWAGFANLIALQRDPSLLEDQKIALAVANAFLTRREKAELTRGRNYLTTAGGSRNSQNYNEFELREFLSRFQRGNYATRVKRYFPPFPIPFVNIQAVTLGNYDFPSGSFPITFGESKRDRSVATWKPTLNLNLQSNFNLQRYPKQLSLPRDSAERLLDMFKRRRGNGRTVYLAIFAEMQSVKAKAAASVGKSAAGYYNVVAKRVALFMDNRLKLRLAEFSMKELLAPGTKSSPTFLSISESKLETLYNVTPVTEDQLARLVERLSDRKGFTGAYVRSMYAVTKVNELEKERVFNEYSETLRFVKEPSSYWLIGGGTFGRYDTKKAGFPIYDWHVTSTTGTISQVSAKFRTEFEDVKNIAFIKMERKRAAALLERYPSRRFLLRVKVTPIKATWQFRNPDSESEDPQLARYAEANVSVRINEVYVLTDPNSDQKGEKALIAVKVLQK